MESVKEQLTKFKQRQVVRFQTLITELFLNDDGEFFTCVFREKERLSDLVTPTDLDNVQKKVMKWIETQLKGQHQCL